MPKLESTGPVVARFEFDTERLGRVTFECVLDKLLVETVWKEATPSVEEMLDMPFVCFGPDTLVKMVLRETDVLENPDDNYRYGRIRKVE
jgi:hypothetical protein